MTHPEASHPHGAIPFSEALRCWARIALLSFGGPAGQIAVMHRILVEEKRWVSENRFLHALNYCMLLPGPEAQQLAIYIGWLLHRTVGGLVAGTLFVLPGFLSILALSILYAGYRELRFVDALFYGLAPAVMAVVLEAVFRIGRRVLKNAVMMALAAAAFVAIFFFSVPFPLIILAAAVTGFVGSHLRPDRFVVIKMHEADAGAPSGEQAFLSDQVAVHTAPTLRRAVKVSLICLLLWFVPIAILAGTQGRDNVFVQQGLFFSKAATVTFGGAYAVLAYVAQQAVDVYGWLEPGEMLTGLGMAETTPGPLIQVVQFVGFMGGYRAAEAGFLEMAPMTAGILASVLVTWVTFVPCFLWIFLGAPYIEKLRGNQALSGALSAVTAAVVGVILNLAVWFALHTVFETVEETRAWGVRLLVPHWQTLDAAALLLAAGALVAIFRFRWGMMPTLGASVVLGFAWRMLGAN